jgi:hypothetical protein
MVVRRIWVALHSCLSTNNLGPAGFLPSFFSESRLLFSTPESRRAGKRIPPLAQHVVTDLQPFMAVCRPLSLRPLHLHRV